MNKKTAATLIVTGLFAAFSLSQSVLSLRRLQHADQVSGPPRAVDAHFILYVPDTRNSYFAKLVAGAERAAVEKGAALSVHGMDAAERDLGMASILGADGVAVCPGLDNSSAALEQLRARKIPVLTLNHAVTTARPYPFVGTNNFEFGRKIGTALKRTASSREVAAVIYSDKSPAIQAESELVEMGITAAMGGRLASPVVALRTDLNPRGAERIVSLLLRSHPEVTTLVFTDESDTLAGTQSVIDMNLVGRVRVFGFGDAPAIRQLVDKGIIYASFCVNPDLIGYQGIISLAELHSTGYTSQSVDTGISIIMRGEQ